MPLAASTKTINSMSPPPLSIIIITYNNAETILSCLRSIPWTTYHPQVIIIDNHSSDRTLKRISSFSEHRTPCDITLIANRFNRGYAHGINQGLRLAAGESIMILGPDAALLEKTTEHLFALLHSDPHMAMVVPQHQNAKGRIIRSCRYLPRYRDALIELTALPSLFPRAITARWKMPEFDHTNRKKVEQPEATCWLMRREILSITGGMDEQFPVFFNDVDWCRRLKENGLSILFSPEAKIIHESGGSVRQQPIPMIWKSHQGFYRYFEKYNRLHRQRAANQALGFLLIITATIRSLIRLLYKGKKHASFTHL